MTRLSMIALAAAMTAGPVLAESHAAATETETMTETGTATETTTTTDATDSTMNAAADAPLDYAQLIRSRDITGGEIYTINGPMDDDTWGNWESEGVGPDWNDIGEIEDIVLDRNGQMVGVVAEIGGFLDIGDKHVLIPMSDVRLTPVDDKTYVLVTRKTEEELEQMEEVDEGWWD
ncbi:PRC-barrel domain-containing protein [Marinovum sp.]|uniref:PRC-barrel domain-containing protein n=1 Tax=Marinovum sp. TaxID=2024839 RepID=UPI003A929AD4